MGLEGDIRFCGSLLDKKGFALGGKKEEVEWLKYEVGFKILEFLCPIYGLLISLFWLIRKWNQLILKPTGQLET